MHNLTIDQAQLFYRKALKNEMDTSKLHALIAAQAIYYASPPSMGETRESMSKKRVAWNKFINTFDSDHTDGKKVIKTIKEAKRFFGSFGVPVR